MLFKENIIFIDVDQEFQLIVKKSMGKNFFWWQKKNVDFLLFAWSFSLLSLPLLSGIRESFIRQNIRQTAGYINNNNIIHKYRWLANILTPFLSEVANKKYSPNENYLNSFSLYLGIYFKNIYIILIWRIFFIRQIYEVGIPISKQWGGNNCYTRGKNQERKRNHVRPSHQAASDDLSWYLFRCYSNASRAVLKDERATILVCI